MAKTSIEKLKKDISESNAKIELYQDHLGLMIKCSMFGAFGGLGCIATLAAIGTFSGSEAINNPFYFVPGILFSILTVYSAISYRVTNNKYKTEAKHNNSLKEAYALIESQSKANQDQTPSA